MPTPNAVTITPPIKQEESEPKENGVQENGATDTGPGRPTDENTSGSEESASGIKKFTRFSDKCFIPATRNMNFYSGNLSNGGKPEKPQATEAENCAQSKDKFADDKENKENEKKTNDKDSVGAGQPKAMVMVKPQVLTHVIEGFVIQESSEPFPVNRGCMDGLVRKMTVNEVLENGEPPRKKSLVENNKDGCKEKELATCETCGKKDLKSKFKKSKRFCSLSCAKR